MEEENDVERYYDEQWILLSENVDMVDGAKFDYSKVFEPNTHLIWLYSNLDEPVEIPEGYNHIKSELAYQKTSTGFKRKMRHFFKNNVPIKADLYIEIHTEEVAYHYPGMICAKEKVLSKTL